MKNLYKQKIESEIKVNTPYKNSYHKPSTYTSPHFMCDFVVVWVVPALTNLHIVPSETHCMLDRDA